MYKQKELSAAHAELLGRQDSVAARPALAGMCPPARRGCCAWLLGPAADHCPFKGLGMQPLLLGTFVMLCAGPAGFNGTCCAVQL